LRCAEACIDAVAFENLDLGGLEGLAELVCSVVQVADVQPYCSGIDEASFDLRDSVANKVRGS
jgi:hypothetical protein